MNDFTQGLAELGIGVPSVLLPRPGIDLTRWAVIACDQYTSDRDYWREVSAFVDGLPSTLNLIFPEIYLEDEDYKERIFNIHQTMERYLEAGRLVQQKPGFIYVERKTPYTPLRKGLIVTLDLEKYDYHKGSQSIIRGTEDTITSRLPARIRIREKAPLELPHILVLIDDPDKMVLEPLTHLKSEFTKLYDFELMMNSGHLTGYQVGGEKALQGIYRGLQRLADPKDFLHKYEGADQERRLLFAVGDGNHSLASAKAVWEKTKAAAADPIAIMTHPARYALVELVNLYDEGLTFEPIHRVLFNVNRDQILASFRERGWRAHTGYDFATMTQKIRGFSPQRDLPAIGFVLGGEVGILSLPQSTGELIVSSVQGFLDSYLKAHPMVKIDYLHGDEALSSLGAEEGNIGLYLPTINKEELFRTVMLEGALPRKSFSLGEAEEKRFYLESRRIL